jgi:hypothetical protein
VLNLLQIPLTFMPIAYGGLLLSGYAVGLGILLRTSTGISSATGIPISAIVLGGLQAVGGTYHADALGSGMTASLAAPFIHTGAILFGIASLPSFAQWISQTSRPTAPLAIVSLLAAFSDLLYVFWFLTPATLLWLVIAQDRRDFRKTVGSVWAASIAGVLIARLHPGAPTFAWPNYSGTVSVLWQLALRCITGQDPLLLVALIVTPLMGFLAARTALRINHGKRLTPERSVLLLIEVTQCCSLAVPVVLGRLDDPGNLRYALPIFVLPSVWLMVRITGTALRVGPRVRWASAQAALVLLILVVTFGSNAAKAANELAEPTNLTKCLLKKGLREGLADYWNAKSLVFYSNYDISIVQVTDDGHPYRINYNSKWFTTTADGSDTVQPNFIVLDRLRDWALVSRFGMPVVQLSCSGSTVWVYSGPLRIPAG